MKKIPCLRHAIILLRPLSLRTMHPTSSTAEDGQEQGCLIQHTLERIGLNEFAASVSHRPQAKVSLPMRGCGAWDVTLQGLSGGLGC